MTDLNQGDCREGTELLVSFVMTDENDDWNHEKVFSLIIASIINN